MLDRNSDLAKIFIGALHGGDAEKVDRLLVAAGNHFEESWLPTVSQEMDELLKSHRWPWQAH